MKKSAFLSLITIVVLSLTFLGCEKNEDAAKQEETEETDSGSKPAVTTIKFAANGVDCGITDGFANQQHSLPALVHLNLDKCNGEVARPTLTLNFEKDKIIAAGTYPISTTYPTEAGKVYINSDQYNFTNWIATAGSVEVTVNTEDATKIDIELKSITMANQKADDTLNPATDTLTGYIIKI